MVFVLKLAYHRVNIFAYALQSPIVGCIAVWEYNDPATEYANVTNHDLKSYDS